MGQNVQRLGPLVLFEPLFRSGFEVTDGYEKYQVTLVDLESSQYPMVLFVGALPPPEQDLWVVASNIAPLVRRKSDGLGGIICFVPGTRINTPTRPKLAGESHEGYVRRICSKNRLFHPAFLRMTLSDFLSFALLSRFIAMCLMTAKFLGP